MRIEVTADHIARSRSLGLGKPDSCNCPVALAIAEQLPVAAEWVSVGLGGVTVKHGGAEFKTRLPSEALWFVHDFDMGNDVEPFGFELAGWSGGKKGN